MSAKIISAFPACGKSTFYKKWSQYSPENVWQTSNSGKGIYQHYIGGNKILDSDSSLFSWIYDENGNKTDDRNPEFPNNYIQHIKDHMETEDIIFVSSHKVVRDALREAGIPYTLIYPEKKLKPIFIERCRERGNSEMFIKFLDDNFENFIDEMEEETYPDKHILTNSTNDDAITVSVMNYIMNNSERIE